MLSMRHIPVMLALALAAPLLCAPARAAAPPPAAPRRPAITVTTAPVELSSLPYRIDAIGSVQPIASVQ